MSRECWTLIQGVSEQGYLSKYFFEFSGMCRTYVIRVSDTKTLFITVLWAICLLWLLNFVFSVLAQI